LAFIVYLQCPQLKLIDTVHPPQFIEADFIDLNKVYTISKFRSGIGHSIEDSVEKCVSLRHIYGGGGEEFANAEEKWNVIKDAPAAQDSIDIYAPVSGMIIDRSEIDLENTEGVGQNVVIRPDRYPGFKVRIDSIFLDDSVKRLGHVDAGQKIGVVCTRCPAEIFVSYTYLFGVRAVSYISALPDSVFAEYQKRGLQDREDATIPREYRDAHPFECEDPGDQTSTLVHAAEMDDMAFSHVLLSGYEGHVEVEDTKDVGGDTVDQ